MSQTVERTAICPNCGKKVVYVRSEMVDRFANGGPITLWEGMLIILRMKWINNFGRKYVCTECGKSWFER